MVRYASNPYQSILDNTNSAFVYHRIITDSYDKPIDYEFIEVSRFFERITGIEARLIVGKTLSQLVPDLSDALRDLISFLDGKLTEGPRRDFEFHCEQIDKWYNITVYSPQPGFLVTIFNDITDVKQAEQQLRESEQRWKYALEGAGDGVWDWDIPSGKVFYSHQWKAMLGYDDNDVSDDLVEWRKWVHPEDLGRVATDLERHLKGETSNYSNEHRCLCKDGSYKWILDRGMIIERDNGKPQRMIGTHSDISKQKMAEAMSRQHQENLVSFFNNIGSLLFVLDFNGIIQEVNQTTLDTLGYDYQELLGRSMYDLLSPENLSDGISLLHAVMEGRSSNQTLVLVNQARNITIPVDVRIANGMWNGNRVLFAACRDVTELHLSEAKFFRAFHINPALMSITTLDEGRYVDANKSFYNRLGYEREEVIGQTSHDLGIYEDFNQRDIFINIVKTEGKVRDFETMLIAKNGRRIIGLLSSEIIRIGTNDYLLTNVTDITERRLMELELEKKNRELEKLNKVLRLQASTDGLTEIYNHRYIFQRLQEEVKRAGRYNQPLSIMMLDLDHFKIVNDRFGHQTGDVVLHTVAQIVKRTLRNLDAVGRYGGEEFLVILPQTKLDAALKVAQRIRKKIEQERYHDEKLRTTISIGVAEYHGESGEELIAQADRMLYQAKDRGRNRVEYQDEATN